MHRLHVDKVRTGSKKEPLGHPVIAGAGVTIRQTVDIVLARTGLRDKQVKFNALDPAAQQAGFQRNPDSIHLRYLDNDPPHLRRNNPKAEAAPFSKCGVSIGLITSNEMVKNHPDEVKAFAAAPIKGRRSIHQDPEASASAPIAAVPPTSHECALVGVKIVLGLAHTPATHRHALGWMADSDWKDALAILKTYSGLKTVRPREDCYTIAFLPQG